MKKACKCSMDQESIIISCYKYQNDAIWIQEKGNVMTDLHRVTRLERTCSWLVSLAYTPRKRLGWSGGFVDSYKYEIVSSLFWCFFKFGSCSCASKTFLFLSANVPYILRNELGFRLCSQSSSIIAFDLDLIHLKIFLKISQNQSFCAHKGLARIQSFASWI